MSGRLGISIGRAEVRALVRHRRAIAWAGRAPYAGPGDLADVIARLAAEGGGGVRACRVVLERDVVQIRLVEPAPPLRGEALRSSVALQAARLFRSGPAGLVTDALRLRRGRGRHAMWAAAADATLAGAVAEGCDAAGLRLDCLGPAVEVLPKALADAPKAGDAILPGIGKSERIEVHAGRGLRSSRQPPAAHVDGKWRAPLGSLGDDAPAFAAAFAATLAAPSLLLLPREALARRRRAAARRLRRLAVAAAAAWLAAGGLFTWRTAHAERTVAAELAAMKPVLDRTLVLQRDLHATAAAVEAIREAEARRSRYLALLAGLTRGVGDSVALVSLRIERDSTLHLAGYAPVADGVIAALERTPGMRNARIEAPASRQSVAAFGRPAREWDRFALAASLERLP